MTGQAGTDGGRHRLLDQVDAAGAGTLGTFLDGALLDRGGARGHADDHPRAGEAAAAIHPADEVLDHLLRDLEVGDDAVAQGADGLDVAGRAADHLLGLVADGQDLLAPVLVADRHHGRLVEDDAAALDVDQRVGRAEIDRHVG